MLKNVKHIFVIWAISLIIAFSIVTLSGPLLGNMVKYVTLYQNNSFPKSNEIVLVTIDTRTLDSLQSMLGFKILTLPKDIYVQAIENILKAGARGIAFDIVFANKTEDDEHFKALLAKHKNIVIGNVITGKPDYPMPLTYNYPETTWGYINPGTAKEYILESLPPYRTLAGPQPKIEPLSLALYRAVGEFDTPLTFSGGDYAFGKHRIPLNAAGNILIPYFGKPYSYPAVSVIDVVQPNTGKLDFSIFKGKYVFIGESGTLIHDTLLSPVTRTLMPGVEVHAHMLDALIQGRFLREVSHTSTLAIMVLLLTLGGILFYFLPLSLGILMELSILVVTYFAMRYAFSELAFVFEAWSIFVSISISFPVAYIYKFFITDKDKRFLKNAFAHYIDPTVVDRITRSTTPIELGGEKREMTVFFSDIAGFTTISEKLGPKDLFLLMSSYLSVMTDILIRNHGTLDKYIGDAIMGFFGAPLPLDDHPLKACMTAIEQRNRLPEFNAMIARNGLDPIDFRVGIATGEVMVGNIGSKDRFNYTVLGDTVNLASRLEGAGKEYHVNIIVSESVYAATKEKFIFRQLDRIRVKGKTVPISIYELLAPKDDPIEMASSEKYETALSLYFQGKYLEAGRLFEANSSIDPPSKVMALRCLNLLEEKRTLEEGVWEMKTK